MSLDDPPRTQLLSLPLLRRFPALLLLAALVTATLVAAACDGAGEESEAPETPVTAPTAESGAQTLPTGTPTPATTETTGEETGIEAAARTLLADEVGEGAFTLESSESVQWSDASLGCPMPDFMYAQVITPGHKLVFDRAGTRYAVHTNADGSQMVICEDAPARPTDAPTPIATETTAEETAIEAAARELLVDEVGEGAYTLESSESVEWPDTSLGCPMPDFMYAQVITPGHKLVFDLSGTRYAVHTNADGSQMVICEDGQ